MFKDSIFFLYFHNLRVLARQVSNSFALIFSSSSSRSAQLVNLPAKKKERATPYFLVLVQ